jgi:branched-chain amino acid transport system ATP-binding protein
MTVRENLEMGTFARRDARVPADVEACLARFPLLREHARRRAGDLSGGQQQLLELAMGLLGEPVVLLVDEPSMGLAPVAIAEVWATLTEIRRAGTTILLVEQNALMALSVAHRGYVIQTGRIVLQDTAANLKKNKTVRKAYLGME